jgi:hypothetical protein
MVTNAWPRCGLTPCRRSCAEGCASTQTRVDAINTTVLMAFSVGDPDASRVRILERPCRPWCTSRRLAFARLRAGREHLTNQSRATSRSGPAAFAEARLCLTLYGIRPLAARNSDERQRTPAEKAPPQAGFATINSKSAVAGTLFSAVPTGRAHSTRPLRRGCTPRQRKLAPSRVEGYDLEKGPCARPSSVSRGCRSIIIR